MKTSALGVAGWPATRASSVTGARRLLPLALMTGSGAASLVWQMVWTAGFGVALGHELVAVLAVLGAFFGGLAGGAWLLAGAIERSPRPGLWYAALEALIGAWGLFVTLALPALSGPLARWIGPQPHAGVHGAAALLLPLVLLLPATVAMGATLPALERQLRGSGVRVLPALYAGNTAGALIGALAAVFIVIPGLGLRLTAEVCAALNLACAVVAALVWRASRVAMPAPVLKPVTAMFDAPARRLFATGLLGVGYEVLAVRVLSQVCENTVYTYALLLAGFLLGTAAGAALLRQLSPDEGRWEARTDRLLLWLAMAVLVGGMALYGADRLVALPGAWMGPGQAAALLGEALAGAVVMVPPALLMGALFSLLCLQARAAARPLGRAFGLNTLGCAVAPALVGAGMAPFLGSRLMLALLAGGYLALRSRGSWQRPGGAVAGVAIAGFALLGPPLQFVDVPEGGRILRHREGAMATVSVVADADDVARLHINNRVQEGSTAGGMVELRLAQLPLLLHRAPQRALFLGLGTGYTANAAALDPRVQVRAVELLPEVISASNVFLLRPAAPRAAHPVDIVAADARRFVQADTTRYDVIVADLFHPARSGAGSLYTVEHFRAVRERLAPQGVFCQWLALHQMDVATLRSITAAFLAVYPDAVAVLASNGLDSPVIGLVARPDRPTWTLADVDARLARPTRDLAAALTLARIDSAYAVLGAIVADSAALRQFAGGAPVNTDDLPVVAHRAAHVDYAPESRPRERLAEWLHLLPDVPAGALDPRDPDASRLTAYWHARARYLRLGLQTRTDPDPRVMLDALGPQLLALVASSVDFQPAADSLAGLAHALQGSDYTLSQEVLAELRRVQGPHPQDAIPPLASSLPHR